VPAGRTISGDQARHQRQAQGGAEGDRIRLSAGQLAWRVPSGWRTMHAGAAARVSVEGAGRHYSCPVSDRDLAGLLREHASKNLVPGAAIGVLRDGEAAMAYYGVADMTTGPHLGRVA
jgi:hypothetical protein